MQYSLSQKELQEHIVLMNYYFDP